MVELTVMAPFAPASLDTEHCAHSMNRRLAETSDTYSLSYTYRSLFDV